MDAFAHRLKEVDAYMEVRKKLGQKSKAPPPVPAKGATKGKGKGNKGAQVPGPDAQE